MAAAEVEFHSGVADKTGYACRLLRKAWRSGARVVVTGQPATLAALDRELWTFDERDFVPHRRIAEGGDPRVAALTPIWLCDGEPPAAAPDVRVNLDAALPRDLGRWRRLIEIVGTDAADAAAARARWREYQALGVAPRHVGAG